VLEPHEIVQELDRYIIGQKNAKKAVAIALRNRWRRQQVEPSLREEISPKNIIMIGPTGVGKTEISRRLAKLADAPFIKVEATKFTEIGYVGKDVESIIRDLTQISVNMVRNSEQLKVKSIAIEKAEERVLDILLPKASNVEETQSYYETRQKFYNMLKKGELDNKELNIVIQENSGPKIEMFAIPGLEEMGHNVKEMFANVFPKKRKNKTIKLKKALEIFTSEEAEKLIDMDNIISKALINVQQNGIVFLDEIDKIAHRSNSHGADVSREGVQRDILPIVEGTTVNTKYGMVKTDHILFIASGAFHMSKPSDLMPELQGRFPIRVELHSLKGEDFIKILTETDNSLIKQYIALLQTEGVNINFTDKAIVEISNIAELCNSKTENIGARRLHTIIEKLLEEISYNASSHKGQSIEIDNTYVISQLGDIASDTDLSRYIL